MKPARVYAFVIVAAVLLAYGNSFSGPFIFDDLAWIPQNPHIRHLWPLWDTLQAPHGTTTTGRPLVCLTLALNYAVGGLEVWGYHAVNLAIHVFAALVLFGIVRRTLEGPRLRGRFGTHASGLAAAVAVCWAVHPLQTESVTYIIQRMESLMGLLLLLTLYCVIRGNDSPRHLWWYAAAIVCCALGMGSKEDMVVAPIIALLYDRTFLARSWLELGRERSGLYAGLAATWLILIALVVMSKGRGLTPNLAIVSPWHYAQNQFGAVAHYLRLAFWPNRLCLDYGWQFAVPRSWAMLGTIMVWPLLAATAWALVRAPSLGFLGAWFFLTLAPSSSLVPIQDMVAERRMYLPLAAVVMLTVLAVWYALTVLGRRLAWTWAAIALACVALSALIAGTLAWRTAQRNQDYRSGVAIWTDTIDQRPQNVRAWNNLGYAYYKAGQVDSAIAYYQRATKLRPTYAMAHANWGNACIAQGRYNEAITHLSEALRLSPEDADAHNDLGFALQQLGDRSQAMVHFRAAIRAQPDHARAHYNLSVLFTDLGEFDQALQELQAVRRLLPDRPEILYKLGLLLSSHGRYAEACANFAEAVRLKPDFEQAREHLRFCEEKSRRP
jgi:Flp pilus assembly protein TadD